MTIDLGASVAPQSLTMREILEVTADSFIILGLTHRAITRAGIWTDHEGGALYNAAESQLTDARADARENLDDWLGDMKQDGDPRFFNQDRLIKEMGNIEDHYTRLFNQTEDADLGALIAELSGRDFDRLLAVEV